MPESVVRALFFGDRPTPGKPKQNVQAKKADGYFHGPHDARASKRGAGHPLIIQTIDQQRDALPPQPKQRDDRFTQSTAEPVRTVRAENRSYRGTVIVVLDPEIRRRNQRVDKAMVLALLAEPRARRESERNPTK